MCTNPALLDGGDGTLEPLVNFDYLFGVPAERDRPRRGAVSPTTTRSSASARTALTGSTSRRSTSPGDTRPDLGAVVASGSNYHVPEVNLAEGNLLTIAQNQTDSYEAHVAKLQAKLTS